ncbi:MAG: hypothetical protein R6U97_13405, partial [Desulfosalsimonas sp.]
MREISLPRWVVVLAVFLPLVLAGGAATGAASQSASGKSGPQAASTGQEDAGGGVLSTVSEYMDRATDQLNEAGQGFLAIPDLAGQLAVMVRNPDNLILWAKMAGWILLVLLAGFIAEWIARRILKRQCRSVENQQTDSIPLRVLLSAVRIFLEIIPIAVFAAAAYAMLPFAAMSYEPRLIALTLINASVLARIILAVFRIVLIPRAPSLRVLSITEESSFYLYIWIRRIAGLGVYGYFILEAVLLAGAPEALHVFLLKFLGLAVTAMLVVLVLQNKNEVAVWLHGEKAPPGRADEKEFRRGARRMLLTLRNRL